MMEEYNENEYHKFHNKIKELTSSCEFPTGNTFIIDEDPNEYTKKELIEYIKLYSTVPIFENEILKELHLNVLGNSIIIKEANCYKSNPND